VFLAAIIAAMLIFVCIAQYARKETVTGYLTLTSGTAEIFVSQHGDPCSPS
jgi:membrane fusion protein